MNHTTDQRRDTSYVDNDRLTGNSPHHEQHSGRGHINDVVRIISNQDTAARYNEKIATNHLPLRDSSSANEVIDSDRRTLVSWEDGDVENPYNWSSGKKWAIVITTMILIINSTMGSALPSMAVPYITHDFGVTSQEQKVLPITTYLMGYVFGPMIWGPLSEHMGRRNLTLISFMLFMVWTLGSALAPNWSALLVFRFLSGAVASAPIAIVAGQLADIYNDPLERGRAYAWFMATTVFGPLFAPIISGFCSTSIGWRWSFWVALIYAGLSLIPVLWLPETYEPVLLRGRAQRIRKAKPNLQVYAASELQPTDLRQLVTRVLTRPLRMIFTELIVTCTCMYLALCYSIFYMSFQAFPLIFQGVYGLSPGVTGLCFLPIGAGALLSLVVFYLYDGFHRRAQQQRKPWSAKEEYRRLPLACFGGPMFVISLFWLGWTAKVDIPFVVPMLAGLPFGIGFQLIFMALLNYLTDAYEVFAASANAAASATRSFVAVILPLATTPMFERLGISGACSLLASLSLLMCIIPFLFIWKGEQIRARSTFCIELKRQRVETARKVEHAGSGPVLSTQA